MPEAPVTTTPIASATAYETIVGMEVHTQLDTVTKMYCGCRSAFGDEPNTHVCPICLGWPGSLPVVNAEAVRLGLKIALALGCTINHTSQFARKNYFYPDLPKGYQITQYEYPIGEHGALTIRLKDGSTKDVGIRRVHLEEDTAKLIHVPGGETFLDHNRAGLPLMEIVTEPDIHTPEEAEAYLRELQGVLRNLGASRANLEAGQMRCEANVSLTLYKAVFLKFKSSGSTPLDQPKPPFELPERWFLRLDEALRFLKPFHEKMVSGVLPPEPNGMLLTVLKFVPDPLVSSGRIAPLGDAENPLFPLRLKKTFFKSEMKNLNSFAQVVKSIQFEVRRMAEIVREGKIETLGEETRGFNEKTGETFVMRVKETAADYRYFPEPDLPPLVVDPAFVESLRESLEPTPLQVKSRLVEEFGLDFYTAELLVDRGAEVFFRQVLALGDDPKEASNWITGETYRLLNDPSLVYNEFKELAITPSHLHGLLEAIKAGGISKTQGKEVWEEVVRTGHEPTQVIAEKGMEQISDQSALIASIDKVLDGDPALVQQYLAGKEALLGAFVGKTMKSTGGKANPTLLPGLLKERLEARRDGAAPPGEGTNP